MRLLVGSWYKSSWLDNNIIIEFVLREYDAAQLWPATLHKNFTSPNSFKIEWIIIPTDQ